MYAARPRHSHAPAEQISQINRPHQFWKPRDDLGGGGAAATAAFLETHYHQPSDDMKLPFKWGAARLAALNLAIARELADTPKRPSWNKGDFFGTLYGGYGATGK